MQRARDTPTERLSSARAKRDGALLIALCASALPFFYLAYYIYSFGSALPVNDQWDAAPFIISAKEGHLDWPLLFSFHNEHLIAIPRLLFAGLALLFTWDNRAECWLTFVFVATTFGLLCRVVLKDRERDEVMGPIALVVAAVFLFSTTQWQNWLWGFQLAWPIPVLTLTAAIPSLYRNRETMGTVLVIVAASMAAVLSMGSGFMVPLILFVILSARYLRSRDRRLIPGLILSASLSALAVGFFFANKPPGAGTIHLGLDSLRGVAILLANPFLDYTRSVPESLSLFFWFAFIVSALLIVLLIWFSIRGFQANAFETPLFSTGFALGAWALLNVTVITLARANSGFEGLAQSRYISYAVLLPVGLSLMAVALLRLRDMSAADTRPLRAWIFLSIVLAVLPLRGESSRLQWGRDMHGTYLALSEFLKVAPAFPIEAELRRICPRADRQVIINTMAQDRLMRGLVPPGTHVPTPMVQTHVPIGFIDTITPTDSGSDLIGWCGFMDARGIPNAVFVGTLNADGSVELIAPILDRQGPRPDVAAQGGPLESGWQLHLSAEYAGKTVTLFAYDWASNRFYQGSETKRLGVMSAERQVEVERPK
jgi:hypothetical protein